MAKIKDIIRENRKTFFSIEITPPDRGKSIREIYDAIDNIMPYNPQFINVTYHQPHAEYVKENGVIKRIRRSRKPGTIGVCSAIQHKYNMDTVPHIICGGFNKYETEDALIDLHYIGIDNVFAVRGDPVPGTRKFIPETEGHSYASELVAQIADLNMGKYLDAQEDALRTDFCIGVAGYPEKHYESLNLDRDIENLKNKADKGADYIITQMCFDINAMQNFVAKSREAGITVPIIAGIKPVTSMAQIEMIPRAFNVNIPMELIKSIESAKTKKEEFANGIKFMENYVRQLLDLGLPGIHVFTMGKGAPAKALLSSLFGGEI
jgi:methylenetetrahydrofolate reductase (NADPH)